MFGNAATLLQLLLTGLVLCAAGFDMRWRIIPNGLTLAIALIAPLYWLAAARADDHSDDGLSCPANFRCACCAGRLLHDGTRALGATEHGLGPAQRRLRCCQPRNWHAIG